MSVLNSIQTPASAPSADVPAAPASPEIAQTSPVPAPSTPPAEWLQSIPEGWRADPNVAKYKTMEDFLGGHKALVSKLGERATEKMVGSPEEYSWKPKRDLDADTVTFAKSAVHALGLSDEKAAKVLDYHFDTIAKMQEEAAQAQQEQIDALSTQAEAEAVRVLKDQWGPQFDTRIRNAQSVINSIPEISALCENESLHNSPEFIKVLDVLHTKFGMDRPAAAPPSASSVPSGDGGFNERLKSIETHPDFENPISPNFHVLQQQRLELYRQRYG